MVIKAERTFEQLRRCFVIYVTGDGRAPLFGFACATRPWRGMSVIRPVSRLCSNSSAIDTICPLAFHHRMPCSPSPRRGLSIRWVSCWFAHPWPRVLQAIHVDTTPPFTAASPKRDSTLAVGLIQTKSRSCPFPSPAIHLSATPILTAPPATLPAFQRAHPELSPNCRLLPLQLYPSSPAPSLTTARDLRHRPL